MPKGCLIALSLALLLALSGMISCDGGTSEEPEPSVEGTLSPSTEETISGTESPVKHAPRESNFNLVFRYGIMAGNTLDTFQGTYTKDMVSDPSIMVELNLSEEEKDRIYQKMVEIDFFNYPENFSIYVPPDAPSAIVTPYASYYFKVEYNSQVKELWWEDEIVKEDEKADRLRELISFIRDMVESKEEYKRLPEPTSGYL